MNQPNAAPERIELPNGYYAKRSTFDSNGWIIVQPNGKPITYAIKNIKSLKSFSDAMNRSTPPAPDYAEVLERIVDLASNGLSHAKVFDEQQRQFIPLFANIMQDAQAALAALKSTAKENDNAQ